MARDDADESAVRARMAAQQIPWDRAQVVLVNDSTPEALSQAVEHTFFDKNSYICKL